MSERKTRVYPKRFCTVEGCSKKHYARDYCKIHYDRDRVHGDPFIVLKRNGKGATIPERFWDRVQPGPNGCRLWTGALEKGYGKVGLGPKHIVRVHRYAWFLKYGVWPQYLLHSCDVKHCVNVEHLREGTHAENVREAVERGLVSRGERHKRAKLTNADARKIHQMLAAGIMQKDIAKQFGVDRSNISRINTGMRWTVEEVSV